MKLPRRTLLHLAAGAAALSAVSSIAWAQTYPTRAVRIIVTERQHVYGRLHGQCLSERLGQPFIVENRPGGGNLGAAERHTLTSRRLHALPPHDFARDQREPV